MLSDADATPDAFHTALLSAPGAYLPATVVDNVTHGGSGLALASAAGRGEGAAVARAAAAAAEYGQGRSSAMVRLGWYAEQLEAILASGFSRRQVLVLWYEAALRDLLGTLRDVEGLLGLPAYDFAAATEATPSGHLRLRGSVAPWDRVLETPFVARGVAALGLADRALPVSVCAASGVACGGHNGKPMRPDSRALLDALYAPANGRLLRLLRPPPAAYASRAVAARAMATAKPPPPQWTFECPCYGVGNTGLPGADVCSGLAAARRFAAELMTAWPCGALHVDADAHEKAKAH